MVNLFVPRLAPSTSSFYENGRRVQRPVGDVPREAKDTWNRHCNPETPDSELQLRRMEPDRESTTVAVAFNHFLEEVKAAKEPATYDAYRTDLNWVGRKLSPRLVSQVTRHDILRVMGKGREEALDTKTVNRKLIVALMALGNPRTIVMKRGDWPKGTDPIVEVYEPKEMTAFFRVCTPREKLVFETFLCSGFRAREVATLTWNDVDPQQRTLRVRRKPEFRFKPKNHEERTVPVPSMLMKSLAAWRQKHGDGALIFPTPAHPKRPKYGGDKPNAHHLEMCKQIAWRARLNCRHCSSSKGKCASGPYCERWTLHKWRHTFATSALRSNVDIKTLQVLLGHKNLATTEKYLRSLPATGLRRTVEKSIVATILRGKR